MKRFAIVLLAALATAGAPGCSLLRASHDQVEQTIDAYNGVVRALEMLDRASVDYLESRGDGLTANDVARAKDHAAKLQSARASLIAAKTALEKGDAKMAVLKLAAALIDLDAVAAELEALGVKLDSSVQTGLDIGHEILNGLKPSS